VKVIDAVARDSSLDDAFACVRSGGTVSVIGIHSLEPYPLPILMGVYRSITLRMKNVQAGAIIVPRPCIGICLSIIVRVDLRRLRHSAPRLVCGGSSAKPRVHRDHGAVVEGHIRCRFVLQPCPCAKMDG